MSRTRLLEVAALASVVAAGCTFLGWGQSGRSVRSSYGLFQAAGRAGVLPSSIEQLGWLFFFVPALVGAALVALALHHQRIAAVLFVVTGAATSTAALLVVLSPLNVRTPAMVAGAAGVVAAVAGLLMLLTGRSSRADRVESRES